MMKSKNKTSRRTDNFFQGDPTRRRIGQQWRFPLQGPHGTDHGEGGKPLGEGGHPQQVGRHHQHLVVPGETLEQTLARLKSLLTLTVDRNVEKQRHRKYKNTSKTRENGQRSISS